MIVSQIINDFIIEMKLRGKSEIETVKAKDLNKGDRILLVNIEYVIIKVTSTCVFFHRNKKKATNGSVGRIGINSQERILKL